MIHTLAALVLFLLAWAGLRLLCGARFRPVPALLLDGLISAWCWAVVSLATDRLLLGAIITAFGAIGLALANDAKYEALRERLAFSDRAELLEVVRHPEMYLPFVGTGIVLGAVAMLTGLVAALEWFEPPLLARWWLCPPLLAAFGLVYFSLAIRQWLRFLSRVFQSWAPDHVPDTDIPRFGLLACFVIHGTLARFERESRRAPYAVREISASHGTAPARPVILVQLESFFDLNRLNGAWGAVAPNLSRLQRRATQFGSFGVPCWGAYTIRTEFAVLAGIEVGKLGLDQYNPYDRFARAPLDALAWQLRRPGHPALCIHPFDLNFYGRAGVLPKLGFERLIGPKEFSSPKAGYVTDQAIVDRLAEVLREHPQPSLVFAITIAGHGPWKDLNPAEASKGSGGMDAYLQAMARMDDILPQLESLADQHDALLAIYGDHQPSLPKAFASLGFSDTRTDYLIYDPRDRNESASAARQQDLAAHELRPAISRILERVQAGSPATAASW